MSDPVWVHIHEDYAKQLADLLDGMATNECDWLSWVAGEIRDALKCRPDRRTWELACVEACRAVDAQSPAWQSPSEGRQALSVELYNRLAGGPPR